MGRKAVTTEEFIRRSKEVHGDTYDYSQTKYVERGLKLTIICKTHGSWQQYPGSHLNGSGCKLCSDESHSKGTENFIKQAKDKHGDKFDYSEVMYKNAHADVTITCPKHGSFKMRARKHLRSPTGCPQCSKDLVRSDTDEFVLKARLVHGDKYCYDKSEYRRVQDKVIIHCKSCGNDFRQVANTHLVGRGCPHCSKTGFDPTKDGSLYIFNVTGKYKFVKFGISNNPLNRLRIHKNNLNRLSCKIDGLVTEIQATVDTVLKLERYIKTSFNCKQVKLKGYTTESIKNTDCTTLLEFCEKWLTSRQASYKVSSIDCSDKFTDNWIRYD